MSIHRDNPRTLIERLLVYGAVLAILLIVLIVARLYPAEATQLLIPGALASLIAVLVVYIVTHTLLRPTGRYLSREDLAELSLELAGLLPSSGDCVVYSRWYAVPWSELLAKAMEVEFAVSYMDTWVNETADALKGVLDRGGLIRVFLPKPGTAAAKRVVERFQGSPQRVILDKIEHTPAKLNAIRRLSSSPDARLEVFLTEVFCMHCVMRIDNRYLILSPFDHFRGVHIDAPAIVLSAQKYEDILKWAAKEFDGFRERSERWAPSGKHAS